MNLIKLVFNCLLTRPTCVQYVAPEAQPKSISCSLGSTTVDPDPAGGQDSGRKMFADVEVLVRNTVISCGSSLSSALVLPNYYHHLRHCSALSSFQLIFPLMKMQVKIIGNTIKHLATKISSMS